jgi:hypothetical protein
MLAAAILLAATTGAPTISIVDAGQFASAFFANPSYESMPDGRKATLRIINAYELHLPRGRRVVATNGPAYLPVTVKLDDGSCFTITANYMGGRFASGSIAPSDCGREIPRVGPVPHTPPVAGGTRLGLSWGFALWSDPKTGGAVVSDGWQAYSQVLMSTRMKAVGINAMRGVDTPDADVSLTGTLAGRTLIVTVNLAY